MYILSGFDKIKEQDEVVSELVGNSLIGIFKTKEAAENALVNYNYLFVDFNYLVIEEFADGDLIFPTSKKRWIYKDEELIDMPELNILSSITF